MCGIIGIVGRSEVAAALYDGLTVLQHRGQDAAGIATFDGHRLHLSKGNGLVRDVFNPESMARLRVDSVVIVEPGTIDPTQRTVKDARNWE